MKEFPKNKWLEGKNGVELIPRNTRLYTPADFDYSPYFDIKKYPFMGTGDSTPYRDLPWNKDGVIGHGDKDFELNNQAQTNLQD